MSNTPHDRAKQSSHVSERVFYLILAAAIAVVLTKAYLSGRGLTLTFQQKGNDDIMRLLTVRDWLAGQSWFDMTQYRLLPPEGVELHWSRYIDLGIAAFILPFAQFLPMATAEMVAAMVWPTFILILTVLVVGLGTRRIFGSQAAIFAVIMTVAWPLSAEMHSRPGNLDHHNVQILLMVVMTFAMMWYHRPQVAGVVGGISAALSVAIGLESIVFIICVGLIMVTVAAVSRQEAARKLLGSFCLTLPVASLILWVGQTRPSALLVPVCDQLSLPAIALVLGASLACLVPLWVAPMRATPVRFLMSTALISSVALALAWPLIGPCLSGPYGALPQDLQSFIATRIVEALPIHQWAEDRLSDVLHLLLPIAAAVVLGVGVWRRDSVTKMQPPAARQAFVLLMLLLLMGTAMLFYQMRTIIVVTAIVPIATGVILARMLQSYLLRRDGIRAAVFLWCVALFLAPYAYVYPVLAAMPPKTKEATLFDNACRSHASLASLNAVPPARIISHISFGPSLLWATHHISMSSAFHRSAAALRNSYLPFELDEAEMRAYLLATDATHLLLCKGFHYEDGFARRLSDTDDPATADWLKPVEIADDHQLLFEILR